jgi:hypothetical protein
VFQSLRNLIVAIQNNTGIDTAVLGLRKASDVVTTQRVFLWQGPAATGRAAERNQLREATAGAAGERGGRGRSGGGERRYGADSGSAGGNFAAER